MSGSTFPSALEALSFRFDEIVRLLSRRIDAALADYGDAVTVQLFSSLKKTGIEEVEKIVGGWLGKKTETDQTGHDGEQEKPSATGGGKAEGEVA